MKRLVLGLLKLLLQLLIFAVTGNWVRIGESGERDGSPPSRTPRKRERAGGRAQPKGGQRRIFDARGRPARRVEIGERWQAVTLEELEAARAYEQSLEEQFVREIEGGERPARPRLGRRGPKPSEVREPPRRSLARALRDPHTVRKAIVLGAALAPRRSR